MRPSEHRRTEQEIFDDLRALCTSPGYIHALALIGFRDNVLTYRGEMTSEVMAQSYRRERTLRIEHRTLLGLMMSSPIDFAPPARATSQLLVERTYALLEELHACLRQPMVDAMVIGVDPGEAGAESDVDTLFARGDVLREAIFYGGESAYGFQYGAFALERYGRDDAWLRAHKGFGVAEAHAVAGAVSALPSRRFAASLPRASHDVEHDCDVLPAYVLTTGEVSASSGVRPDETRAVLEAFAAPIDGCNAGFQSLGDFNDATARPLLRIDDDRFVALQAYDLLEALYDAPFYWMAADAAYRDEASIHRGTFTEEFVAERLVAVFGRARVHRGVTVRRDARQVTDIDVLVTFADRALVIQCKSKRLTLEARRGNDLRLRDDFQKSVQHACDQGRVSADALRDPDLTFELSDGTALEVVPPRLIFPLCVVSDHYPALAAQARQFLRFSTDEVVRPPLATDVFAIDVMAEMLGSPLRFLDYLDRRSSLGDRISSNGELSILGFHLTSGLWASPEHSFVMIDDACAVDLDVAMTVRREGLTGRRTPRGFLDRFGRTPTGRILASLERGDQPWHLDLGLLLLTLSGRTLADLDAGLVRLAARARREGRRQDVSLVLGDGSVGLTVHCGPEPTVDGLDALRGHCERRKYVEGAGTWFGLLLRSADGLPAAGLTLRRPWERDDALDLATRAMAPRRGEGARHRGAAGVTSPKVGRNAQCPCGSGRKHKRCCL